MIGATDNNISLLSEIDMLPETPETKEVRHPVQLDSLMLQRSDSLESISFNRDLLDKDAIASLKNSQADSTLAGSVLSAHTWRQLAATLREKTVRS